jgi:hypothetical protein
MTRGARSRPVERKLGTCARDHEEHCARCAARYRNARGGAAAGWPVQSAERSGQLVGKRVQICGLEVELVVRGGRHSEPLCAGRARPVTRGQTSCVRTELRTPVVRASPDRSVSVRCEWLSAGWWRVW